jgi:transposase
MPAEAAAGRVIAELAGELDRVSVRRDALAAEIEEAFLGHPSGELLASMPGIGLRTGARILAEIGDGSAYATGSKLAAYVGLAPVTCQSGTTSSPRPAAAAATTGSRTPCSSSPSHPCATPPPKRSTTANAPKANALTPHLPNGDRSARRAW